MENNYNVKIGLEIHMHLKTKEKLFCDCKIPKKTSDSNVHICPICTGQPGSKPMLPNKTALFAILKLGIVFNSSITKRTYFQRKHYTWPDMPTGFQRTVSGGNVKANCIGGKFKDIEFEEIHLEENPAGWDPITGEINYNRSGFPLAEIVTKPQFHSSEELKDWLKELILVAKYLNIYDEDFGIKSDVNVSIKESNFQRVEIKNVNSYNNIVAAAETEIKRQRELVKKGEKIKQETRRYNEELNTTEFMRSKENAQDYMYTPEPDLPNLVIDDNIIEELKKTIPQLPEDKRKKYSVYSFDKETIDVLVSNLYLSEIFEDAIKKKINPKEVGLFLRREILRVLNYNNQSFEDLENMDMKKEISYLIELLGEEKISYTTAQKLLEILFTEKIDLDDYIAKNNLLQVHDTDLIENLVINALKEAPKAVEDFKSGNEKALNFIVGIVMKKTNGTAKPAIVNEILMKKVKEF